MMRGCTLSCDRQVTPLCVHIDACDTLQLCALHCSLTLVLPLLCCLCSGLPASFLPRSPGLPEFFWQASPLGVPQDWQTLFLHILEQQSLPARQATPSLLQALHVRVRGWQPRPGQHLGG